MSVPFLQSRTKENLMRAFAGESQARNRYTFAAGAARSKLLPVVAEAFEFTARQEKEHGEIFYRYLLEASGENIFADGQYPVDISDDVTRLLYMARHNEFQEWQEVYPAFAAIAREEGFDHIGDTFARIALIERSHGQRFERFARMLENGTLFDSQAAATRWVCLNCGEIVESPAAPTVCPVCRHERGYFVRETWEPFR